MDEFWRELLDELPTTAEFLRVTWRLLLAAGAGALPGSQREHAGEAAGLRTHMLVALGSAAFVLAAKESGASADAMMHVYQGIVTGIGFVGAGAILKMPVSERVKGLTTAASIYVTSALGTAIGAGRIWLPLAGGLMALCVLSVVRHLEPKARAGGKGVRNLFSGSAMKSIKPPKKGS